MKREWYPLDNAANIYPIIQTRSWTSMFRIVALMKSDVDIAALQLALDKMKKRFPGFYVRLRRGFFWYYLESVNNLAKVERDTLYPCPPVVKGELLFRVKVHNNRIAAEFSHIICDGSGGTEFFKTLLFEYVNELGAKVNGEGLILSVNTPTHEREWEDAFLSHSASNANPTRLEPRAYKLSGTRLLPGVKYVTTGVISVKSALELARKYKVSITEYMAATLIYMLYILQKEEYKNKRLRPVKVSVPVNLRKYYKTKTLRNFSQYLNPGIDPNYGEFTFEETLNQVHHYFRFMFTEKNLHARFAQNVGAQRNIALRLAPLLFKRAAIRLVYELTGETVYTSVLSNLGEMKLPHGMGDYIERFDLMLNTAKYNAVECAMISYGDTLSISFTRGIAEPYAERLFFTALIKSGLHVKIESNVYT